MSNLEKVQDVMKKYSNANIDEYVATSSFNEQVADAIRDHISLEFKSWAFFRKLGADCSRSNIALHGFASLWSHSATECFADAHWLEKYLIQRGGVAKPSDIPAPKVEWPDDPVDPIQPVYEALQVEKRLLEDCLKLCKIADEAGDYCLEDIIESRFLRKESRHVKDMGDLLQQCVRVSKQAGHGVYHLDKELRASGGKAPWGNVNDPDASDQRLHEATTQLYSGPS